ncbi:hypothetical protein KGM_211098 [Danaus plexippus plexippus]|uniref:Uncharacterized protein n=1 Tax=Danaus plexippus plexippus TaxID=278856 RepID=A0A212EK63_DANPL|nr:hypothetical protein KGM_211098 [Danaus plexippus plexippus]
MAFSGSQVGEELGQRFRSDYPAGGDSGGCCSTNNSLPSSDHRDSDGSAHMWRPTTICSAYTFIFDTTVTQRGLQRSLHKSLQGLQCESCTPSRFKLQVGARLSNRSDGRHQIYFGKIQIWNGWYSRLESELRRSSPFLELDCACAGRALPVFDELPPGRVARYPGLLMVGRDPCMSSRRSHAVLIAIDLNVTGLKKQFKNEAL